MNPNYVGHTLVISRINNNPSWHADPYSGIYFCVEQTQDVVFCIRLPSAAFTLEAFPCDPETPWLIESRGYQPAIGELLQGYAMTQQWAAADEKCCAAASQWAFWQNCIHAARLTAINAPKQPQASVDKTPEVLEKQALITPLDELFFGPASSAGNPEFILKLQNELCDLFR